MTMNVFKSKLALMFCGLLLTVSPSFGQGTVIYHNAGDVLLISSGGDLFNYGVDMDGNGTDDFVFEAFTSFQIYSTSGGKSVGIPIGGIDLGNNSVPLLDGFSVQPLLGEPLQWTGSTEGLFG
jgi:hypothetical protein